MISPVQMLGSAKKFPDAVFSGDLAATADAVSTRHSKTAMRQVRAMVVARFRARAGTDDG